MFASISGAPDPSNEEQFDFRLQAGSPCIDTGGFLTTITSTSGSGTSFVVDDAGYFMDGWGVVAPDVLQLEGQAQAASVVGVDYVTNTITVDTSLTWTQGQGVGLQYEGAAPDLGAYEFAPPTESCGSLGGGCCASGQACSGGQFESSLDCAYLCCVGGSCEDAGTGGGGGGGGSAGGDGADSDEAGGCACSALGSRARFADARLLWLMGLALLVRARSRRSLA
jgi:hypothetical protein